MSDRDRAKRQLEGMGYLTLTTPVIKSGGLLKALELLEPFGLGAKWISVMAEHRATKEDIENPCITWFEVVNGEYLEWYYHPSKKSEMLLFKLTM